MNWLIFFYHRCHNVSLIYFICLDKAIETNLPKYGLSCSHVHHLPAAQSNNRLWLVRARVTKHLLEQGYDVLMTDSDAIWLQNPFLVLQRYQDSDVVASRASFPEDISAKLGATVCMGFIYIRASNKTVMMWDEVYTFMSKTPRADDQRNFNQLLVAWGIRYDTRPSYLKSLTPNLGSFELKGQPVKLTLLPHAQFMRMCDPRRVGDTLQAVVAHCISPSKSESTKASSERVYGIWALSDDWAKAASNGSALGLSQFVRDISSKNITELLRLEGRR